MIAEPQRSGGPNGLVGGVLAIHAATLNLNGALSTAGLGYRGGKSSEDDSRSPDRPPPAAPRTTPARRAASARRVERREAGAGEHDAGGAPVTRPPAAREGRTIGGPGAVYGVADASQLTMSVVQRQVATPPTAVTRASDSELPRRNT